MSNKSIFGTHPAVAFTLRTVQATVLSIAFKIGKNLIDDLSKYVAKHGTSAIEGAIIYALFPTKVKSEQEISNCQAPDLKEIELEGVDSSTQTITEIEL